MRVKTLKTQKNEEIMRSNLLGDPLIDIAFYFTAIFLIFYYRKPLKENFKKFFGWWIQFFSPSSFLFLIAFLLILIFGVKIKITHKTEEVKVGIEHKNALQIRSY
jgi:hypothetical protein